MGSKRDKPSRVTSDVDLTADGKQFGYLSVPHSRNDSAWGSVRVPIVVAKNGDGPTVFFTGGNHGDEYEGPIALLKLARSLEASQITGRVIIMPALNLPAVRAGTRLSPIDGLNMNRVFPGVREGTVTQMIADYVYTTILPHADVVVDIHAGGKTMSLVPCAVMHQLEDKALMDHTMAALLAFGAPFGLVLQELDSEGMLDTAVEDMGKVFISTELGGGGTVTTDTVGIADSGIRNILCHFGLIDETVITPQARGLPATRLMHTPDEDCLVVANDNGLYEILVDLGREVAAGTPIGRIHFYETPERAPSLYKARRSGMIVHRHVPGLIQAGDCLALIATDYDYS
ncbi:MAG: N(2)-acetyl-L-2,4-diaminobutanoate deacetylase DoeB [Gammaproteobacteria bacterium]|nr:N(2)-acetyl-L-2,4-diaminobutanoate deacetylase DoeB [Gammaproteobacteria bacterium]